MLLLAFATTSLTVLLGGWLLAARCGWVGLVHGLCGAAGVAAVLLTRRAGGLASAFGADALWLLAAGLGAGLIIAGFTLRRRRPPELMVVLHVALAGIGYLLLAGFALG